MKNPLPTMPLLRPRPRTTTTAEEVDSTEAVDMEAVDMEVVAVTEAASAMVTGKLLDSS